MVNSKIKEKELAEKFGAINVMISNSTVEYHTSDMKQYMERNTKNPSQQRSCEYIVKMSYLYSGYIKEVKYFFNVYVKALAMYDHFKDISVMEINNYQLN